jgi:hypothetical protein
MLDATDYFTSGLGERRGILVASCVVSLTALLQSLSKGTRK